MSHKDRSGVDVDASPTLLVDNGRHKLWHGMSDVKAVQSVKVWFGFVFSSKYSMLSAKNSAMMSVFCNLARASLRKVVDEKYDFDIQTGIGVFTICVCGYSQHIERVVMGVIEHVASDSFDAALLEAVKQNCKKNLKRKYRIEDIGFKESLFSMYLSTGPYSPFEVLEHIDDITADDVLQCASEFVGSATVETLAYGNIRPDEAVDVYRQWMCLHAGIRSATRLSLKSGVCRAPSQYSTSWWTGPRITCTSRL